MEDISMKSVEMQGTAANGSENAADGAGVGITVPPDKPLGQALEWAWKKARAKFNQQTRPPQAVNVRREGFPDVVIHMDDDKDGAKTRLRAAWQRGTVSELAIVDLGEDGQPLEHEVGEFAGGAGGSVSFDMNFGDGVAAVEPTTAPPETPKAEEFPEFGSVDLSRVVGSVVSLADVPKPSYLVGYSPALAEASATVRRLGAPETLVAAVSYASIGLRSFPLVAGGKIPVMVGGFKVATSEVGQLVNWFDDGEFFQRSPHHDKNLGIATGETDGDFDLLVLDVDVKGGKDGGKALAGLAGELGSLPVTLIASTPSGGLHYLFKTPKGSGIGCGVNVFRQHGDGLDIRAHGGYIVASPSVVDGKAYQWLTDLPIAWLPDSWIAALKAECGKDKAHDSKLVPAIDFESNPEPLTDQQKEDVRSVIGSHSRGIKPVVDVDGDQPWFDIGAALKRYGQPGYDLWIDASRQSKHWDEAECAETWERFDGSKSIASIFAMARAADPTWVNPSTRRKAEQEAAVAAQKEAARVGAFGVMPDWIKDNLSQRTNVSMPIAAVSDDRARVVLDAVSDEEARRVLGEFIAVGKAAPEGSEAQFIAGMLLMDDGMIMPHVRKHPTRTKSSELRGIVRYANGSKPDTAESIDWERVKPSLIWGGSDMVTRLANNIKAKLSGGIGVKGRLPNAREDALVRGVVEVSAYGLWVREAVKTGEAPNGWNLESIITQGLNRADGAPEQGTGLASSVSGNVLPEQPSKEHGGALAWLRELYAIPWGGTGLTPAEPVDYAMPLDGGVPWIHWKKTKQGAYPTCTPENVGVLLALYGHRVRWNDMRYRVEYEGFPCDPGMDDEAFKHVKALTARNNLGWKDQDVSDMMSAWASHWRFHPAKEWIESKPWDGVSRIVAFADTVTVQKGQRDNWQMYFRRWALGAIHALYSSTGGASKHALVLHGEQSKGKTSWFRTLAGGQVEDSNGNRLGGTPVLKEGVMLNVKDKDSVAETVTWWLVELGELEATYSTKQLAELKAFTTKQQDEWRAPFDRKSNTHRRRTAFVGTVNGDESLADYGGNTRWATVTVGRVDYQHDVDAQQMWAEVLHIWKSGAKEEKRHWLTKEEEAAMERQNDQYVARGGFYDRLALMFDWKHAEWVRWAEWARKGGLDDNPEPEPNPAPPCIPNGRLHEVMGFTTDRPPKPSDKNEIAAALKKLGAVKYRNNDVRGFYLPVCAATDAYKGTTKGSYIK